MVKKIDLLNPQTGRRYKDDDSVINTAEMIEAIRDALVTEGVPLKGRSVSDVHTFHDEATVAADGTAFTVGGHTTLTVEITGTSTSRTVDFKGAGPDGTYRSISGVNLDGLASATSTTGTGELWQFDITGLETVIMDLSAVSDGNVTVKGRAVA